MTKKYTSLEHQIRNIVEGKPENVIDVDSIVESVMEELQDDIDYYLDNFMVHFENIDFGDIFVLTEEELNEEDLKQYNLHEIAPAALLVPAAVQILGAVARTALTAAMRRAAASAVTSGVTRAGVTAAARAAGRTIAATGRAAGRAGAAAARGVGRAARGVGRALGRAAVAGAVISKVLGAMTPGQGSADISNTDSNAASSPSDLSKYMHMAKPYVSRQQVKEDATEERSKIENVARPNSRRDKAVKQQEIQKKIIEEKKSLAQVVKKNIEDTRKEKKNSTVIINPTLNKPETGGY